MEDRKEAEAALGFLLVEGGSDSEGAPGAAGISNTKSTQLAAPQQGMNSSLRVLGRRASRAGLSILRPGSLRLAEAIRFRSAAASGLGTQRAARELVTRN